LDFVHVHHQAAHVYGNDAHHTERGVQGCLTGAESFDFPFRVGKVHVQGHGIAIDQQRNGALVAYDFSRGGEGHGRDQHGLTGPQAQRVHGQVQGGGAGIDRYGMFSADFRREGSFEMSGARTCRKPAGAEAGHNFVDFTFADRRAEKRDVHWFVVSVNGCRITRLV
jgi:hypothetical protein